MVLEGLDNRKTEAKSTLVSVIIPVSDDSDSLRNCLRHLACQSYPSDSIEILVIDYGSTDSLAPFKSEFPGVVWLFEPDQSSNTARNRGIIQARGEVLAFTNADCLSDQNWILNGVEQLKSSGASSIIVGHVELVYPRPEPQSTLDWYQHILTFRREDLFSWGRFGATANLMTHTMTFETVGLFDGRFESFGTKHWGQLAETAGCTFVYAPAVRVRRPSHRTYGELITEAKRQARESLTYDFRNQSSRSLVVWNSLRMLIPDPRIAMKIIRRRERLSLLKVAGVFCVYWMLRGVKGVERISRSTSNIAIKTKRFARQLTPYPKLWAYLSGNHAPTSYITGGKSRLIRPESISFSASGDLLGVCNSEGHSVGFYPLLEGKGRTYANKPCYTISNSDCLNYVHDAVISPCGTYLATVARDAHTLSLFDGLGKKHKGKERKPLWSFTGKESGLNLPTGVAIHPSGKIIAVANRRLTGITLYRKLDAEHHFKSTPFQTISELDVFKFDLASPHGLDFSSDGKFLVVAHKRFKKWGNVGGGQSGLAIFKWHDDPELGLDPNPTATQLYGNAELHSVSIHPSDNLIAVSDEGFGVNILSCSANLEKLTKVKRFPIFRVGSGVKGAGFTRDGNQIAVTCDLNEVLFFATPAKT